MKVASTVYVTLFLILSAAFLAGCGSGEESTEPAAMPADTMLKPMEEYREQAEEEITSDTAEQELNRLAREIEADTD